MMWYEQYRSASSLTSEEREFLSRYTEEEFQNDFTLIFPDVVIGPKIITLFEACQLMMKVGEG